MHRRAKLSRSFSNKIQHDDLCRCRLRIQFASLNTLLRAAAIRLAFALVSSELPSREHGTWSAARSDPVRIVCCCLLN